MSRSRIALALAACLAVGSTQALRADVKSDQKTRFQLAGALGKVVNFFGGRAAREGVTSTVAVKGNRKMTTTGQTGQIVDLSEEKVYDLDIRKKSYKVKTFAQIRQEIEDARKRAEEEAKMEEPSTREERDPNAKEAEIDFEVKNTGETKAINGFDTTKSVMTITVREKGKTLEEAGGLVMTSDLWLTPTIAALQEVTDFDMKYFQKLYGPVMAGASPQDMAAALAMYPMLKPAMEKMAAEGRKLQGTAIMTVTTVDAVKGAEQMAAEAKGGDSGSGSSQPASVGGLIGGFGRRMANRNKDKEEAAAGPKNRSNVMTTTHEVLKVATAVTAEDVALPAGFKEDK